MEVLSDVDYRKVEWNGVLDAELRRNRIQWQNTGSDPGAGLLSSDYKYAYAER